MTDSTTMVERLLGENGKLSMVAAGVLLGEGQGGSPIHPTTVTRWCLKGVRVNGAKLKLEHLRAGGKLLTTRAAIVRFLAAQTDAPEPVSAPRTPTQRRRAAEHAEAELEKLGV
ncbi:: DUF1580 [Gemmata massiliana]|uniref:: DUF1580 n=1 Tax=Gemmata massiliana TaxID=1210884 RepID=A0A6P2CUW9_9BACT|nr:DUF1580 domain-containing protein [Gemmata massiliana]VTR92156.1 : DUF1580 [Gemmata massiliana]